VQAVKCLSVTQPWATLLVLGVKRVETRSWPTNYRGPLAIHAAKGWDASARALAEKLMPEGKNLPRGAVVGVVELMGCRMMTLQPNPHELLKAFSLTTAPELWSEDAQRRGEGELGGYEEGRYAWTVKNPRELLRPVTCRGALSIFELPPEVACAVEAELVDPTREAFEERAAILEFDAGLPRAEAERQAELFTRSGGVKAGVAIVVNLRKEPFDVYIGRDGHGQDGYFGNPFPGEPLERYEAWFLSRCANDTQFRHRVETLRGNRLGCFCKPGPCHGDVIAAYVNGEGWVRA
jgi:hypothetical protein